MDTGGGMEKWSQHAHSIGNPPNIAIKVYISKNPTFEHVITCTGRKTCKCNSLLDQLSWLERPTVNREVISSILISSEHFFFVCPFLFFCLSYILFWTSVYRQYTYATNLSVSYSLFIIQCYLSNQFYTYLYFYHSKVQLASSTNNL